MNRLIISKFANFQRSFAILLSIYLTPITSAADNWSCIDGVAAERRGSVIFTCGIGRDITEPGARLNALENSIAEFNKICALSADCKNRSYNIIPKRNSCKSTRDGHFQCYRGQEFELLTEISATDMSQTDAEISQIDEQIDLKNKKLEALRKLQQKKRDLAKLDDDIKIAHQGGDIDESRPGARLFDFSSLFVGLGLSAFNHPAIDLDAPTGGFDLNVSLMPRHWLGLAARSSYLTGGPSDAGLAGWQNKNQTGFSHRIGLQFRSPSIAGFTPFLMPTWGLAHWTIKELRSDAIIVKESNTQHFIGFTIGMFMNPGLLPFLVRCEYTLLHFPARAHLRSASGSDYAIFFGYAFE